MATSKKIHVNSSSLIDLKAELFRKHEALKAEKHRREVGNCSKEIKTGLKEKKANAERKRNVGVEKRAKKDETQDVCEEDSDVLQKSREILEKKTRIYDTLTKGKVLPDDDIKELYLVDFEKKVLHNLKEQYLNKHEETNIEEVLPASGPGEEWVDYVDALGRSRRCLRKDLSDLQEMDKELRNIRNSKSQYSKDQEKELPKTDDKSEECVDISTGSVHYQGVRYNEIRTHGVGYFSFSTDEEQRKIQMESLKNLRDQTVEQRAARWRLKEKRKADLKARLTKVKLRKGIEIESENSGESSDDKDVEIKDETATEEVSKMEAKTRPWDVGKILLPAHRKQQFTQNSWIEKKREERLQEFAPPQFYNSDAIFDTKDCVSNCQNICAPTVDSKTQDIERIIAETVTYYKNKSE